MAVERNPHNSDETTFKTNFSGKEYIINAWFLKPDITAPELEEAFGGRIEYASRSNIQKVLYHDINGNNSSPEELEDDANLRLQNFLIGVMNDHFDDLEPQLTVPDAHQFSDYVSDSDSPTRDILINAWLLTPKKLPSQLANALDDELNISHSTIKNTIENTVDNARLSESEIADIANPSLQKELERILDDKFSNLTVRQEVPTWYRLLHLFNDKTHLRKNALINIFFHGSTTDNKEAADLAGCSYSYARTVSIEMKESMNSNELEAALNPEVQNFLNDLTSPIHDETNQSA